jgi:hypothetical protein
VTSCSLGRAQHDVSLNPAGPAAEFKDAIYQLTGVPVERQKVMIKGGMLKVRRREEQWLPQS